MTSGGHADSGRMREKEEVYGVSIRWILSPIPSLTSHWVPQNCLDGSCHLNTIFVGLKSPLPVFPVVLKPRLLKLRSASLTDSFISLWLFFII